MTKKKPLKDLSLMNRFLFAEVMDNPEACQDMLSIILRKDIHLTSMPQTEKEHRVSPLIWSIRMDVFSISEEGTAYDVEAQDSWRDDLEKRSRYYQSLMDTSLLESGVDSYNELNDSYIIVITDYDIFGEGKYCYTFRARCDEAGNVTLKDGAVRIFLNTHGTNDAEAPKELIEFLHYMEHSTDRAAEHADSERMKRIHTWVRKAKMSEAVGMRYMRELEEKSMARKEGRMEGRAEGEAEAVLKLLSSIEEVPEALKLKIQNQTDEAVLLKWLMLAAKAESLEDFMKAM